MFEESHPSNVANQDDTVNDISFGENLWNEFELNFTGDKIVHAKVTIKA